MSVSLPYTRLDDTRVATPVGSSPSRKPAAMKRVLSGWGNYPRLECEVKRPASLRSLRNESASASSSIARGLGRSYADQALSERGLVLETLAFDHYRSFDEASGLLVCEAGVSLEMILRDFAPRGFLPMITPGTKFVTIGGCIANDVHGKAHHVDGCFSRCTESFRVMLASGEVVNASRDENADLFWASFGGMGLLGHIVEASIWLRKVETTYFQQRALVVSNLDEMLDALDAHNHVPYSVAWVDSLAKGKSLGRGVLTMGDHAARADLPSKLAADPLRVSERSPLLVPFDPPSGALNTATIRVLNTVLDQMQRRGAAIAHYEKFFYPLDFINDWNRGYGKRGFTQYQFVVPMDGARENLRELLSTIAKSGQSPFLNVLKRFGPETPETQLSFPFEGYTFAIDFPVREGLSDLLAHLDQRVLAMGGRIYLGKDAFLSQDTFEAMYPKLAEWKAVKAKYDPEQRFVSSLSRRLGLSG